MIVFKAGDPIFHSKILSFYRKENFELEAMYANPTPFMHVPQIGMYTAVTSTNSVNLRLGLQYDSSKMCGVPLHWDDNSLNFSGCAITCVALFPC